MGQNPQKMGIAKVCSICGGKYTEYGNNAEPINEGRCCDFCDSHFVIPVRMMRLTNGKNLREVYHHDSEE